MSDELFPDAVAIEPVAARPPGKKRGFGVTAFVLGLIALLGDITVGVIVVTALAGIADATDSSIGFAFLALLASIVAFWGGIVLGVLSIIFGIIALVRRRGRGLAIVGMLFGIVTLAANVTVGLLLLFNAQQFDQFGGLFT